MRPGRGFKAGTALGEALRKQLVLKTYRIKHDGKDKLVGWVREYRPTGRRYLLLPRQEEHFYIKGQSVGADTWVFDSAEHDFGIDDVVVIYTGRKNKVTVYRAPLALWRAEGFVIRYEGFDEQLQLPVRKMELWETDA